jgi:hypothetical protein
VRFLELQVSAIGENIPGFLSALQRLDRIYTTHAEHVQLG